MGEYSNSICRDFGWTKDLIRILDINLKRLGLKIKKCVREIEDLLHVRSVKDSLYILVYERSEWLYKIQIRAVKSKGH